MLEHARDFLSLHDTEVIALAARDYGGQEILWLGRRQQKDHVGGRLLQRLQERTRGELGKLVHLVDYVHFRSQRGRHIGYLVQESPNLIDLAVARRVYLYYVERCPLRDRSARFTDVTRCSRRPLDAVNRLGQDTRCAGLACASWPAEQVGVHQPTGGKRVGQGISDVTLAHNILDCLLYTSPSPR